jgi:LytS/YehU family sensor histidine kinase
MGKKSIKNILIISIVLILLGQSFSFLRIGITKPIFAIPAIFLVQIVCIVCDVLLSKWLEKKEIWKFNYIVYGLVNATISFLVIFTLNSFFGTTKEYSQLIINGIAVSLPATLIYVFAEYRELSRIRRDENQQLKDLHAKAEMEVIKQQINPHFLFNSINTVVDMIEENNVGAVTFLKNFAEVYRYGLDSNQKDLVRIEEEMELLTSYIELLKCRFGNKLVVNVCIPEKAFTKLIPPMALQLLLENAIKHNEVSNEHPLEVNFEYHNNLIEITNTIQPKSSYVASNGLGLKNLAFRVEYLMNKKLEYGISKDKTIFYVRVPLVNNIT